MIAACETILQHFAHLLFFGRCGCWEEGRNKHPYWGWMEGDE